MPIFKRRQPASAPQRTRTSVLDIVDLSLPDDEWFSVSEKVYERTWRDHLGSPETFAEAGGNHYGHQNFGVALLFFRKAIDLMHTLYTGGMSRRQPSARDFAITSQFVSSLGATLAMHPAAPVDESVREVTHRLRTISSACKRAGLPADLYLNALQEIASASPNVRVDDVLW
jgi:hypothetical protein